MREIEYAQLKALGASPAVLYIYSDSDPLTITEEGGLYKIRGVIDHDNLTADDLLDCLHDLIMYRVKPDYWDMWGVEFEDEAIVPMEEIERLAIEWEKPVSDLLDQVEEYAGR